MPSWCGAQLKSTETTLPLLIQYSEGKQPDHKGRDVHLVLTRNIYCIYINKKQSQIHNDCIKSVALNKK
jgi:hypothetical protein